MRLLNRVSRYITTAARRPNRLPASTRYQSEWSGKCGVVDVSLFGAGLVTDRLVTVCVVVVCVGVVVVRVVVVLSEVVAPAGLATTLALWPISTTQTAAPMLSAAQTTLVASSRAPGE